MKSADSYRRVMRGSLKFSLFLFLIIASCAPTPSQVPKRTASPPSLPVWTDPENGRSSGCLRCHESYTANHHPIGFVPAASFRISLPLYDGRIRCLTCHEEDHRGGENCLRGGPYGERREICFKCHSDDEYEAINPHVMLELKGEVIIVNGKPICLMCHAVMPNPVSYRTEDETLRADVAFICWRCHAPMVNSILMNHFRLKPQPAMLWRMREKQEELGVTLPLIPRQRITCSTCHNPHQEGVILHEPPAKGADSQSRLRLPSPLLCSVCHIV